MVASARQAQRSVRNLRQGAKWCFTWVVLFVGLAAGVGASAAEKADQPLPVKKSSAGICHAPGTAYYEQTKKFIPYKTIEECLSAGGRLPKSSTAVPGPPVKKSTSGICHDRQSPFYARTKNFTAYESMDECLKSGGRRPNS